MLSKEQIQRLVDLEKEEMVLINRKMEIAHKENKSDEERIEVERIDLRVKEIEAEESRIKDLPKPITRDQLAREIEVSNRSENEIIEEHTKRIEKKRHEIEEQIRKYVEHNHLK